MMPCFDQGVVDAFLSFVFSTNHQNEWAAKLNENLNKDRRFKIVPVSERWAVDDDGDGNDKRSEMFAYLMGVRDEADPGREATAGEMEAVAIALYSYFVKQYLEGVENGHWKRWNEENDFPRRERDEFESHSTRNNPGVFDGFDFNVWAAENLENGFEGVKAVALVGPRKKKTMIWEAESCGEGLKRKIKDGIAEKLAEQGARSQTACDKVKKDIYTEVELFLQDKGFRWLCDTHLFQDPDKGQQKQQKMKSSWTKKVGTDYIILMLKDEESA